MGWGLWLALILTFSPWEKEKRGSRGVGWRSWWDRQSGSVKPVRGRREIRITIMIRIKIRSRSSSAKPGLVSTRSDRVKVSQTNGLGVVARPHPDLLSPGRRKSRGRAGWVGDLGGTGSPGSVKPVRGRREIRITIMIRIKIRSRRSSAKPGLVSTRSDRVKVSQTNGLGVVARPHPDLLPLGEGKAGVARGGLEILVGQAVQGQSNQSGEEGRLGLRL